MTDRERRLWKLYGLTLADYDRLMERQGGACAICEAPPSPGKSLAVDHDHAIVAKVKKAHRTPGLMRTSVRGLLCWLCNHRRIGRGATPTLMYRAGNYLAFAHHTTQEALCLKVSDPTSCLTRTPTKRS